MIIIILGGSITEYPAYFAVEIYLWKIEVIPELNKQAVMNNREKSRFIFSILTAYLHSSGITSVLHKWSR